MEKIRKISDGTSLKKSFFAAMLFTVAVIILLSAGAIWGCAYLQKLLLPDSEDIYLTITTTYEDGSVDTTWQRMEFGAREAIGKLTAVEDDASAPERKGITQYSVAKVENSYQNLSPRRKLAYSVLSYAMVLLPALFSIVGVLVCALRFYKKKLDPPIRILSSATENISNENLDFTVAYDSRDEMGGLCASFEKMRKALADNNRALWAMLEERRMLLASVAHDLRNPIAILKGYTEYLQETACGGRLEQERLLHTLSNMQTTTERLERYTDSVLEIHQVEDLEIHREKYVLPEMLQEITEALVILARQQGLTAKAELHVPCCEVLMDKQMLCRILENIFSNGLRFAKTTINMEFTLEDGVLSAVISDDGQGFPEMLLKRRDRYMVTTDPSGGHMGMGLTVSRILCAKLGGGLKLSNGAHGGAVVEARVLCGGTSAVNSKSLS